MPSLSSIKTVEEFFLVGKLPKYAWISEEVDSEDWGLEGSGFAQPGLQKRRIIVDLPAPDGPTKDTTGIKSF